MLFRVFFSPFGKYLAMTQHFSSAHEHTERSWGDTTPPSSRRPGDLGTSEEGGESDGGSVGVTFWGVPHQC